MKDFITIISRVKHLLTCYSKDYVMGYIYGILDWRVIGEVVYEQLVNFIDEYKEDKKERSKENHGEN